ncbi:MAG TPA: site-specific integrase [Mycobacteriales bacterium]|nr:site-specific integrase [Mycobacteriales bacterium]
MANGYRDPYEDPEWAVRLGLVAQPTHVRTFGVVAAEYLATLVDARRRTVAEYQRDLKAHVCPAVVRLPDGRRVGPLGRLPVDRFDTDMVQAWVGHMRTKTYGGKAAHAYSAKTIVNIHGSVVAPVFDFAVDRGYVGANPCRRVRLPERRGRPVKSHHVLDMDEMPDWIDCAYQVDVDTGDITALILGTGLRWGELTGLRVCDINIRARTLSIAQVVREDENRQLYVDTEEGKSPNAFRTIALPPTTVRLLEARMTGRGRFELLFPPPGTRGGTLWRNANFHTHRWSKVKRLAAERGLVQDPSPHRLRHSHATALIPLAGIESVSKRLGHANVTVTSAIYSHLTVAVDARMADAIDPALHRRGHATTPDRKGALADTNPTGSGAADGPVRKR